MGVTGWWAFRNGKTEAFGIIRTTVIRKKYTNSNYGLNDVGNKRSKGCTTN